MDEHLSRTYKKVQQITLAVDCIIFGFNDNELEVLLVRRGFKPEKGKWSIMGGFVGNEEDLDDAAYRVLQQLSGLRNVYMEQIRTFGKSNRELSERVVSTTYSALILKRDYNVKLIKKYGAQWFPIEACPELLFDHNEMILSALRRLRRRVRNTPVGFNLLPEKFTLPQLQRLYEVILGEGLDVRNFRKKIEQMGFLVKLNEKDKSESKKGAYLYRFDEKIYKEVGKFNI